MKEYTLKELTLNLIDGKHGGCDEVKNSGYYFISVKDLEQYKINYDFAKEISKEDYLQCNKRTKLEIGDTLYANSGDTIGKSLFVKENENVCKTTFQKSVAILKPNTELILPRYLYYLMKYNTPKLRSLASGSAQKNLLLDTMKKYKVKIPELSEQKLILEQLEPIDDLIEKNIKLMEDIENYIKKLYHYWFVQYEYPSSNLDTYNSNGRILKYSEQLKIEIPIDWKVESLYDNELCKLIKTGIDKFDDEKIYLATGNVNFENFDNGKKITYQNREGRANMQPTLNSVWFAKMKDSVKHITLINNAKWFCDEYILSTGFVGLQCNEKNVAYIHSFINTNKFKKIKDSLSHGATQQAINNEDLKSIYLLVPTEDVLELFSKKVNGLLSLKTELKYTNINLEKQLITTINKLYSTFE